jgi:hypothetical protein
MQNQPGALGPWPAPAEADKSRPEFTGADAVVTYATNGFGRGGLARDLSLYDERGTLSVERRR